jgi:integrase
MAWVRERKRKDGTPYYAAMFELADGTQTSISKQDRKSAEAVVKLVEGVGGDRALEILGKTSRTKAAPATSQAMSTKEWLDHYIEHLTGLDQGTIEKYEAYVRNDIDPVIGAIPLASLSREDLAKWVQWLGKFGAIDRKTKERGPASPKTIANKHGFISAALAAAVPKHIPANPAADQRLPQGKAKEEDEEMVFLTRAEYGVLHDAVTEYWRPLVEFLVVSGCRWGEAAALKPADIDRTKNTVRIRRAWTYSSGGYRLVKPKGKSLRTINVPKAVLDNLDYTHEWLFVNKDGGPVRSHGFHDRVWGPAIKRSKLDPPPRIHDLRHTCASWMIAAGVPLPVIQRHLGHQSITTTIGVYGHLDRSSYEQAAEAMAAMLVDAS